MSFNSSPNLSKELSLETPEQEAKRLAGDVAEELPQETVSQSGVSKQTIPDRYLVPSPGSDRAEGEAYQEQGTPRSPLNFNEMSDLVRDFAVDPEVALAISEYKMQRDKLEEIKATKEYRSIKEDDRWKYGMIVGYKNKTYDKASEAYRQSEIALSRMHLRLKTLLSGQGIAINGVFDRELATKEFLIKSLGI